jgi:hypothetical protein
MAYITGRLSGAVEPALWNVFQPPNRRVFASAWYLRIR